MAVEERIDIYLRTYAEVNQLRQYADRIKELERMGWRLNSVGRVIEKTTGKWVSLKELDAGLKKVNPQLRRFRMEWLSVMFAGMQVWRLFRGLFTNMMNTMKQFAGKAHPLNVAVSRLSIAMTFLKVSIMEAATPLLEKLILWLAELAITIANLDPKYLEALAIAIGAIALTGLAAFTTAQVMLLKDAVFNLLALFAAKDLPTFLTNMATALDKVGKAAGLILIVWGFEEVLSKENIFSGLSKIMAGFAWWIPGPTGAVFGMIAVSMAISDIVMGKNVNTARLIALIGTISAFKYNWVLGIITLSVWLLVEGIAAGVKYLSKTEEVKEAEAKLAEGTDVLKNKAADADAKLVALNDRFVGLANATQMSAKDVTELGLEIDKVGQKIKDFVTPPTVTKYIDVVVRYSTEGAIPPGVGDEGKMKNGNGTNGGKNAGVTSLTGAEARPRISRISGTPGSPYAMAF